MDIQIIEKKRIFVEFEESYKINDKLIEYCKNASKILIITEKEVKDNLNIYIKNIQEICENKVFEYIVKSGDYYKTSETKEQIEEFMLFNNFNTKSIVVAIGGGKVTDLGGFIASTYLRGISLINIPTTLLAMADAAIGGKTGINSLIYGKNLIGSVFQPKMY